MKNTIQNHVKQLDAIHELNTIYLSMNKKIENNSLFRYELLKKELKTAYQDFIKIKSSHIKMASI